jgi:hypothetical protein
MKPKITAIVIAVCATMFGSGVALYAKNPSGLKPPLFSKMSRTLRGIDSSSVAQQGASFVATYRVNLPRTPNGTDVTNVMIFEEDSAGHVRVAAYPKALTPGGVSVVTDTLSFAPTRTFIVGLNLHNPPSEERGANHLIMLGQ